MPFHMISQPTYDIRNRPVRRRMQQRLHRLRPPGAPAGLRHRPVRPGGCPPPRRVLQCRHRQPPMEHDWCVECVCRVIWTEEIQALHDKGLLEGREAAEAAMRFLALTGVMPEEKRDQAWADALHHARLGQWMMFTPELASGSVSWSNTSTTTGRARSTGPPTPAATPRSEARTGRERPAVWRKGPRPLPGKPAGEQPESRPPKRKPQETSAQTTNPLPCGSIEKRPHREEEHGGSELAANGGKGPGQGATPTPPHIQRGKMPPGPGLRGSGNRGVQPTGAAGPEPDGAGPHGRGPHHPGDGAERLGDPAHRPLGRGTDGAGAGDTRRRRGNHQRPPRRDLPAREVHQQPLGHPGVQVHEPR